MIRRIFSFLGTKIGISLLIAAVLIAGAIFATRTPEEKRADGSVVAADMIKRSLELDSDGDGLKDWEESLYGTDPQKPDTDGDGMGDNDEVKANRNPLVAGPGEKAEIAGAGATTTAYAFTATDRFSQELFMRYIEAKSSGAEIDEELSNAIAEELLSQQYETFVQPFDVSKLNLVEDSPQNARLYGNHLGAILSTPPIEGAVNELIILDRIQTGIATNNDIAMLQKITARYANMRNSLVDMQVPIGAASLHAEFIQGIDILYGACVGIASLATDPIGAYSKIAQYEDSLNIITAASIKVRAYLLSSNARYSPQESGYPLIQ